MRGGGVVSGWARGRARLGSLLLRLVLGRLEQKERLRTAASAPVFQAAAAFPAGSAGRLGGDKASRAPEMDGGNFGGLCFDRN